MRRFALASALPATFGLFVSCLQEPSMNYGDAGPTGSGGRVATGGATSGTGGSASGSGGGATPGTGGGPASGGAQGSSGGASVTGGASGTGNASASGGRAATGGSGTGGGATGGAGGRGSGGSATGGASATGGRGTGGSATGGAATGGAATGGSGTGGAPAVTTCKKPGAEYTNNGSVTWYTLSQGSNGQVHCSFPVSGETIGNIATGNGTYFAAMNTADYQNSAVCGACIQVTTGTGRSVIATIVDECPIGSNPKCTAGHVDLSQPAFAQIGNVSDGYLGTGHGGMITTISWKYVPCPVSGNASLRLKEGNNTVWNQVLVAGARYAISRVELNLNGNWVQMSRSTDRNNYYMPPNGAMGSQPYQLRVTDINGSVGQAIITLRDGYQASSFQFPTCQ